MSGLKGQCAECGWITRRSLKNRNKKPCPKCGGPIYVHEEDRGAAILVLVAVAVATVILAAISGNW